MNKIQETFDNAKIYEAEPPRPLVRELAPADIFPIDALGSILKSAAEAIQDKTQAPLALSSQSVLAAATLAVQGHSNVEMPNGQIRPISNFLMTVAATGERKSSCDFEALRPIKIRENSLREGYTTQYAEYEKQKEAWDFARNAAKGKAKGNYETFKRLLDVIGSPPALPLHPALTFSDATIEGACKLMGQGQPSMGMFSTEGGSFIGGHGMSEDHKIKTASTLSRLWDGDTVDRVRAGDGASFLVGRRLTVHLMAQPDVAAILLSDTALKSQGFLSRFLVTAPNSTSGTRLWREPKPETEGIIKRYETYISGVLNQSLPLAEGKVNELAPPSISLSVAAHPAWVAFHDEIEGNSGDGRRFAPIRGLANKLPEHALRLAAVIELVSDLQARTISLGSIDSGITLARHYAKEALRLFEVSATDSQLLLAKELLAWLHKVWNGDLISLSDIYQRGPNKIRSAKVAKIPVGILLEHGYLVPVERGVIPGESRRDIFRIIKGKNLCE